MIKVMVVDDEWPALRMAESVLQTFNDVQIRGLYNDPEELLEQLNTMDVDLVFLDIEMPGMTGLELAGRIQEYKPDVAVAFVTAYEYYAVDAFGKEALDYVMKPMTADRLRITLERFARFYGVRTVDRGSNHASVQSFGRLAVEFVDGKRLKFRRGKTEELFAFLLHHRNQPVAKGVIMEALWGDRDAERAQAMLYTTMYQLRKELEAFGLYGVIEQSRAGGGRCRLVWAPDKWDCDEFERGYREFKERNERASAARAVELYRGGYLAENGYEWAAETLNRLELKAVELLEYLTDCEVKERRFEFAMPLLQKWAKMQPYSKRVHAKLVALYLLMGNVDAAEAYERKTEGLFVSELGVSPDIDRKAMALNPLSVF